MARQASYKLRRACPARPNSLSLTLAKVRGPEPFAACLDRLCEGVKGQSSVLATSCACGYAETKQLTEFCLCRKGSTFFFVVEPLVPDQALR